MNDPAEQIQPRLLRFEIPEALPLLSVMLRQHWAKRRREMQRWAWQVRAALGPGGRTPMQQCSVRITRYSAQEPDRDNLQASAKYLMDCLVVPSRQNPHGLGVIVDDNPRCVLDLTVEHGQAKRGQGKTLVVIRETAR